VRSVAGWIGMEPTEVARAVQNASRQTTSQPAADQPAEETQAEVRLLDLPTDVETRMERDALLVMLQRPQAIGRELLERATQVRIRNSLLDVVRDGIATAIDFWNAPDWIGRVGEAVPSRFAPLVAQLGVAPMPENRPENVDRYCRSQVADLVAVDLSRRKAELQGASQRAAAEGDEARARTIREQLAALEIERRRLREG
jgi:DNA primase